MGQLHVRAVTLAEVASHGAAFVATVESVTENPPIVRAVIELVYTTNKIFLQNYKAGATYDFEINQGVKWTDPHQSPIDRRVPGHLHPGTLKMGDRVIVIRNHGFEVVAASDQALRKLEMFFSQETMAKHDGASPEQLFKDLHDADLQMPALKAIAKRKLLSPESFLTLDPHTLYTQGFHLGQLLSSEDVNRWILGLASAKMSREMRARLTDLARESTIKPKLAADTYAALIASLDLSFKDHFDRAQWFLDELLVRSPAKNQESCALALRLVGERTHEGYRGGHEQLKKVVSVLAKDELVPFLKKLGQLVMSSQMAKKSELGLDEWLFEFFVSQVAQTPSGELIPELAAIDLSLYPKDSHLATQSRVHIMGVGLAIVQSEPSMRAKVYRALERWAVDKPGRIMSDNGEPLAKKARRYEKTWSDFRALAR